MDITCHRTDFPQEIALYVDVHSKLEALDAIASRCARLQAIPDEGKIFRALSRREQAGSTALGDGVAIPHARIDDIDEPITLYMRTRSPIEFGASDAKPVSHMFAILVPPGRNDEHLALLARVAGMLADGALRARLNRAATPADVRTALADWCSRNGSLADHRPLQSSA